MVTFAPLPSLAMVAKPNPCEVLELCFVEVLVDVPDREHAEISSALHEWTHDSDHLTERCCSNHYYLLSSHLIATQPLSNRHCGIVEATDRQSMDRLG